VVLVAESATVPVLHLLPAVATGATVTSNKTPVNTTYIVSSAAFGNSILAAFADRSVMILDEYNRDYALDISKGVVTYDSYSLEDQLSVFSANVNQGEGYYSISGFNGDQPAAFSSFDLSDNFSISYSDNFSAGLGFGPFAENYVLPSDLVMMDGVTNPYMNILDDGTGYTVGHNWNEKSTTRFGMFSNLNMTEDSFENTDESDPIMFGANIEHTFMLDKINVSVNFGTLNEQNSVLGNYSDGALDMGASANTIFAGVGLGYNPTDDITLIGGASFGYTRVEADNNSMIKSIDSLSSGSAYLGMIKTGVFNDSDRFGVIAGVPLTTLSGTASAMLPVSRDIDGNISYDQIDIDLKNTAPEYTTQAFYNSKIDEHQSFGVGIGARFTQSDSTEMVGMFKYNLQF
jgi:hypothetical protein